MPNDDATFHYFAPYVKSPVTPLYYAALCRFHDVVEHPITKASAGCEYCWVPLCATASGSVGRGILLTADLLHHNGADSHTCVQSRSGQNRCMLQALLETWR